MNRIESVNDIQSGRGDPERRGDGLLPRASDLQLPLPHVFMGNFGSHFLGVALAVITILGVAKVVVGLRSWCRDRSAAHRDAAFAIVRRRSPAQPRGAGRGPSITVSARSA